MQLTRWNTTWTRLTTTWANRAVNHDIGLSDVHINPLTDSHDQVSELHANTLSKENKANAMANGTNGHVVAVADVYVNPPPEEDIKL